MKQQSVTILGAGYAGMLAALRLQKRVRPDQRIIYGESRGEGRMGNQAHLPELRHPLL